MDQLRPLLERASLALIDMPIGLLDGGTEERACDRQARALLGRPRASSVFRPPCRAALMALAQGYTQACAVNRRETGVGLSKQTFNIMPKVEALDRFLRQHPWLHERLRESHPELCLWWLNAQQAMHFNKRTLAGRRERQALLSTRASELEPIISGLMHRTLRRDLALDDVVDACVLAVAARQILCDQRAEWLPDSRHTDRHGLAMSILIPSSSTSSG
jgi:predicted RNase H-like nuclease